ncbi:cytochrome b5-like [Atheta coriaria]|uniref:cytochrome b5-like n=1 Tax=Dalotia coriaria TaxID=877792 RepID=UPI0031F44787
MFYSPDEIRKHNGQNGTDTWIVVRDVVYDVTPFLDEHPGGPELVQEFAGRDATEAFDKAMHSSSAKKDLEKYRIGDTKWVSSDNTTTTSNTNASPKPEGRSFLSAITCGMCC